MMTGRRIPLGSPCKVEGCHEPRKISEQTGRMFPLCEGHKRAADCAYSAAHYERTKKGGVPVQKRVRKEKPVKVKRLKGRPRQPTIIVDERARVVSRVRGNTVEREFPLPPEGLRAETIWILKRRGWQIRVEGRAS